MGRVRDRVYTIPQLAKKLELSRWFLGTELKKTGIPIRQHGGPRTRRTVWLSDMERYWPEAWASLQGEPTEDDED